MAWHDALVAQLVRGTEHASTPVHGVAAQSGRGSITYVWTMEGWLYLAILLWAGPWGVGLQGS